MAVRTDHLQSRRWVRGSEDFYQQLGRRIAALRGLLDLSQEKLGERARVGSSYIAHIEIGSRRPTIEVLRRIADAVNAPLWRLLTDDRLTPDEKAWDASARDLAEKVHGLAQSDLQALTYLATRLKTAESPAKIIRAAPLDASARSAPTSAAARAAEPRGPSWRPKPRTTRTKRAR